MKSHCSRLASQATAILAKNLAIHSHPQQQPRAFGTIAILQWGSHYAARASTVARWGTSRPTNHGWIKRNPTETAAIFCHSSSRTCFSTSTTSSSSSLANNQRLELYQYAICPFCNKTKAFLDYSGLPYNAIEVNPLTKQEIKWSKDYRKVPLARHVTTVDDTTSIDGAIVWKGSDAIVDGLLQQEWVTERLKDKLGDAMSLEEFAEQAEWVEYTNQKLAVLLYPNLCPTLSDSYRAFAYVNSVPEFSGWQRFWIRSIGAFAMYMAASRVKKKHQIQDERQALEEVLEKPVQHLTRNGAKFLSGRSEPHVGDLAVFGALRGIQGTPIQREILEQRPVLAEWYRRMEEKLQR